MIAEEYQKFMDLDAEKRERILNAAMKEFLNGFKKASTDNIVREAGISKGLLFHYFGTKENLYNFLVGYAIDIAKAEFLDLININQPDILDSIWQLTLLKQDLSNRYPTIFDFMTRVYVDDRDGPAKEHLDNFQLVHAKILQDVYANADMSLFRDDVEPKKAMDILSWTLKGYGESITNTMDKDGIGAAARENYDAFLDEFKDYLSILRRCFYK